MSKPRGPKPRFREYDADGTLIAKECGTCRQTKPADEFYNKKMSKTTRDGKMYLCISCFKKRWHERAKDVDRRRSWLLQRIKLKCTTNDIPFDLTIDDIVVPDVCPVLGIPLAFGVKGSGSYGGVRGGRGGKVPHDSPSIDRIDPALGYTKGNVIIVSNRANFIKSNASVAEMLAVSEFYSKLDGAKKIVASQQAAQ